MVIVRGTMGSVSIAQAKAGFAALVARAEAGEQIIVTRRGRAVACLGPPPVRKPLVYGDLAYLGPLPEDLTIPEDIIADFYKSAEEFEW
jgi:antitoxin (DNA-binding transcriptional repressor) of toxin-antitoxin stability system